MQKFNAASIIALAAAASLAMTPLAHAATLTVTTGTAKVMQEAKGTTNQGATAAATANGEVRNNSKVSSTALNLMNSSDIDQAVTGAKAEGAVSKGSFNASANGSYFEQGNAASSEAGNAAIAVNGEAATAASGANTGAHPPEASNWATASDMAFGLSASGAYQQAASNAWNNGGSYGGSMGGSYELTSLSAEFTTSNLDVNQSIGDVTQTAHSVATSGGVVDYSSLASSAINIGNTSTMKVVVDAGDCGCVTPQ
ncbi:MAG: hypothetical protein AAB883_00660 [Patescibacteria group bacterium]